MLERHLAQVCKQFRLDGCDYGAKCKFAHPSDNCRLIPQDVRVCQDFLGTKNCDRDECKHYHPFDGQKIPASTMKLRVCRDFFEKGNCLRDDCNYAHPNENCAMPLEVEICKNNIVKTCEREDCKFYHDPENKLDITALNGTRQQAVVEECRNFPSGRCTRGNSCRYAHIETKPQIKETVNAESECIDFFHGRCTRGDKCRYSHGPLVDENMCRDFLAGKCTRGTKCRFEHGGQIISDIVEDPGKECLDFFHNRCTRGNDCRFSHQTIRDPTVAKLPLAEPAPRGGKQAPADPQSECLDFFHGHCTRGDSCRYSHGGSRKRALAPQTPEPRRRSRSPRRRAETPTLPCRDYVIGKCTRGHGCRFLHGDNMRCPDFERGSCPHGDDCKFSHAEEDCHDFMHGKCTRKGCRFVHDATKIIVKGGRREVARR